MSASTFAFSSSTLRSLRLEEELLERHKYSRQRSRALPRPAVPAPGTGVRVGQRTRHMDPQVCKDLLVQNALFSGDLEMVRHFFTEDTPVNLIIEARGDELKWTSGKLGVWSLTYDQMLTTPVHITASRGYTDCLKHLLMRGANVEFAPGGLTPLQEACENACTESVRLLLSFGANPNAVSEDGYSSLQYCKTPDSINCAKLLLQYGASVNYQSEEEDDTPLHVAARHGLEEHVRLLLRYGAKVDKKNAEEQTPLNASCSHPHRPEDIDHYYKVCKELIENHADINTKDRDCQRPLHMACKNVNPRVVELLLEQGSSVNIMCYNGSTAMHNILHSVAYKLEHRPESIVRALLNYGAIRVWPGSLMKVLTYCFSSPRTIEALMNTYDRVQITEDWLEAVPPELQQRHQPFFESLFCLAQKPRSLQHLARCAVRLHIERWLPKATPQVLLKLPLPSSLIDFLMLRFEDVLY
ncbi:ankyrin repeat and SOCS box protein 10 [Ambystoma mexicanum]|uniref:ankyrin repeat and SOCS box protein 10 n=1 Tax=Ambystoma mexicanum TaxID=8296 RepID=UPI0037E8D19E